MIPNPDSLICPQANFCTVTQKWLRPSLYRETAPVPSNIFLHHDSKVVAREFVPRSLTHRTKLVPGRQKHAPYPPCTVIFFWLKYLDPERCPRRVAQPPFIAGPLGNILIKSKPLIKIK